MYYLREGSHKTDDPTFMKLATVPADIHAPLPMFFPAHRQTAQWFFDEGIAEKHLIIWASDALIHSDKTFVDIGAHVGTYSWICGKKAAHTYSFECSPEIFCYLAANIALHGMVDRISPYSCALGDREGSIDYFLRAPDGGGNGVKSVYPKDTQCKTIAVPMKTLDSFHLENIGLIKIDVEGFEKEVLKGAEETLKRSNYPKILFECWGDWKKADGVDVGRIRNELFSYLHGLGYKIVNVNFPDMYLAEH